jgi:hypothetical protein
MVEAGAIVERVVFVVEELATVAVVVDPSAATARATVRLPEPHPANSPHRTPTTTATPRETVVRRSKRA